MKIKNILLSSMLVLALGLSGCNIGKKESSETSETPSSSSEIEPVTLIRIEKLASIVVGQAVNLDDYVTVEGGEGPKVFTATVAAASADLAVVEGHTLTALAEGDINVTIAAGGLSAKFSTTAMSALKASFEAITGNVSNTWAMLELYQEQLYIGAVHRPDYSCFSGWGDNNEPGGFLKCQNGLTYSYILDDSFENIQVDPEIQSDFNDYYCNYDFCLSASDFTTTETDDGEVLVLDKHAPGAWGSSYFAYKVEEFAYTLAVALNSNYSFGDLVVSPFTLTNAANEDVDTFLFSLPIIKNADQSTAVVYQYVFDLDEAETEITAVREYIDAGSHPEALAFDELPEKIAAICNAKVYTNNIEGYWYNPTTGEAIDTPTDQDFLANFPVGKETDYVNATTAVQVVDQGEEEDLIYGSIVKDGTLYSFTNSEGEGIKATEATGSDVWADTIDTLGRVNKASLLEGFVATSREVDDETGEVKLEATGDCCIEFVSELCYTSYLGYIAYDYGFNGIGTKEGTLIEIGYVDLFFDITADALLISMGFRWSSTAAYGLDMYITDIGTDNVPELEIEFPR